MECTTEVDDAMASGRQMELMQLLCVVPELSMAEIQTRMGISRTWLYQIRDALIKKGVLYPGERSGIGTPFNYAHTHPPQSTSLPHHAPVRHVWWSDFEGAWAVQAAVLDRWDHRGWPDALPDEAAVVVRSVPRGEPAFWSWAAHRRERVTTDRVGRHFMPGRLTSAQLSRITVAVGWALRTDAVVPPVVRSEIEAFIEDGPR
jgi:hypothetical protein